MRCLWLLSFAVLLLTGCYLDHDRSRPRAPLGIPDDAGPVELEPDAALPVACVGVDEPLTFDLSVTRMATDGPLIVVGARDGVAGVNPERCLSWEVPVAGTVGSIAAGSGVVAVAVRGDDGHFIAALDATDGTTLWRREVPDGRGFGCSVAVGSGGEVVSVCRVEGPFLDGPEWPADLEVRVSLHAPGDGGERWSTTLAGTGWPREVEAHDVAVGDVVLVSGSYSAGLRLDGEPLAMPEAAEEGDAYLLALSVPDGSLEWVRALGVWSTQSSRVHAEGRVGWLAMLYGVRGDIGDPATRAHGTSDSRQLLARVSLSDGALGWAVSTDAVLVRHVGGEPPVIAAAGDRVLFAGQVLEATDFGDGARIGDGGADFVSFAATYDSTSGALRNVESPLLMDEAGSGGNMVVGAGWDDRGTALIALRGARQSHVLHVPST